MGRPERPPERLLWVRVAGDLLDGAVLGWALRPSNKGQGRALLATLAVAPVMVADVAVWLASRTETEAPSRP